MTSQNTHPELRQRLATPREDPYPYEKQLISSLKFTCDICTEEVPLTKRFILSDPMQCDHTSYCIDCIQKYIKTAIISYNLSEIKCPDVNCNVVLDPIACSSFLPTLVFNRWCDALCEAAVTGYRRSCCPYVNCSAMFLTKCKLLTRVTCSTCKRMFCFNCRIPCDRDHICSDNVERADMRDLLGRKNIKDGDVLRLAATNKWRRCPGCNYIVERISGCSNVTCRCGTRFCYDSGISKDSWCFCFGCRWKIMVVFVFVVVVISILMQQ
ncbi:RBR-type E3 ubiquitin transferase [Ranunculus cassubicifolius]